MNTLIPPSSWARDSAALGACSDSAHVNGSRPWISMRNCVAASLTLGTSINPSAFAARYPAIAEAFMRAGPDRCDAEVAAFLRAAQDMISRCIASA
jgi:hypothetical protein